jgi:hypothetical protein
MRPKTRKWWEEVFRAGAAGECPCWAVIDWYARDGGGRVGWFESVGQPIPRATFRDLDAYLAAREAIDRMPRTCSATVRMEGPRRQTDGYRHRAERGFYVFGSWEGEEAARGYRLLAVPEVPLPAEQLPEPLRGWVESVPLTGSDFRRPLLRLSGGIGWVSLRGVET